MEFRYLRYMLAVNDHGSIRQAAAALGISASAISRRIRDLEEELGVALFLRTFDGVTLTRAGYAFLEDARLIDRRLENAKAKAQAIAMGQKGELRIAAPEELMTDRLMAALALHKNRWPDVRIHIFDMTPQDQMSALQTGLLDLAIALDPGEGHEIDRERIWSETAAIAFPDYHALNSHSEIEPSILADQAVILSGSPEVERFDHRVVRHLTDRGIKVRIIAETECFQTKLSLVRAGAGIAFLPEGLSRSIATDLMVKRIDLSIDVFGTWPSYELSGSAAEFLRTIPQIITGDEQTICQ